jgi:mRNA interferase RelE/StbE
LPWTIDFAETARAELRKLDKPAARKIVDYLEQRVATLDDPRRIGKALKGPLGSFWRYRVGDYRVICDIRDRALLILVVKVGNRRAVYE